MKGISPFIAEILLIGFTVAVAAIIIGWSSGFTKTSTQNIQQQSQTQLACSYGGISTFSDIYYNSSCSCLYGYLKNTGQIPLRVDFQIVYDNNTINSIQNITQILPGNIAFFNVSASSNINFILVSTNCTSPPVNYRIDRSDIIFS